MAVVSRTHRPAGSRRALWSRTPIGTVVQSMSGYMGPELHELVSPMITVGVGLVPAAASCLARASRAALSVKGNYHDWG